MKNIFMTMLAAVIMFVMASCASTPRTYEDLNDIPGVNNVYFGPLVLRTAGAVSNLAGADIAKYVGDLTSLRVITANNDNAVKRIRPFMKRQVKAAKASPLLELTKGNGEHVSVYATPYPGVADTYSDVVVITDIGSSLNALVITGKLSAAQINDIIK